MRRIVGVLIAIALGIGVFVLWPRSTDDAPPNTEASGTSTTTTTTEATTTSTTDGTTTTTEESHVVETVEEAETILRELWFGWFEGIYNQDEERIREVVATQHQFELALDQFSSMSFDDEPSPNDISYAETQILQATEDCTVIFTRATFTDFTQATTSDVHVLRWLDDWKIFSLWAFPDDLWEGDCEAEL